MFNNQQKWLRSSAIRVRNSSTMHSYREHRNFLTKDNVATVIKNIEKNNGSILDIGFGDGDSCIYLAKQHPNKLIIGVEVYQRGICNLTKKIDSENIQNIFFSDLDIRELLLMLDNSQIFDIISILFPDPWPKRKQHKRRLVNIEFLKMLTNRLSLDGYISFVSDSFDYFRSIKDLLINSKIMHYVECNPFEIAPQAEKTKYYLKAQEKKHNIYGLKITKKIYGDQVY